MKQPCWIRRRKLSPSILLVIFLSLWLSACSLPGNEIRPDTYDFGLLPQSLDDTQTNKNAYKTNLVISVADVQAPRRLETLLLYYRLLYADAQAPKPYANSRWIMPPPQLVSQRLRNRLSRDFIVPPVNDVNADVLLRIDLETFDHVFETPESSQGVVRLRASLIRDRHLIAQQLFYNAQPAQTTNAAGGVRALTQATDFALNAVAEWVKMQSTKL